ncbi:MAG: hypothetical protein KBC56_00540 [Flavobacterium sp.]|nr:hypothetical protein [Flavobacterium sp.]
MRLLLLIPFLLIFGCKPTYNRINLDFISETEKQRVYDFGVRNLKSCITREFIQLSRKEATEELVTGISLEDMQHTCDVLDKRNGKFIDMKLIEIIDNYNTNSKIYRFKANFQKNDFLNEVRIWVEKNGKFSGFVIREWKDAYIPSS